MRQKMIAIADRLEARAQKFREPWGKDEAGFVSSHSFAVFTALREVANQIKQELKADERHTD